VSESRELRKQIESAVQNALVAQRNEMITRQRMDALTKILGHFLGLSLRHRLRWVLFGMPLPPFPVAVEEPVAEEQPANPAEVVNVH
jgi:hypothetical protein